MISISQHSVSIYILHTYDMFQIHVGTFGILFSNKILIEKEDQYHK